MTLDIARAIAIVAIVLGHVLRGLAASGVINGYASPYPIIDNALYSFHLTVFAFLAGLFVKSTVDRQGVRSYLRQRNVTLVYLYVVWSSIQTVVKLLTAPLVNIPSSVSKLVQLWAPEAQFWFLPFLGIACTAAALVRPWRHQWLAIGSIAATALLSVATWGLGGSVVGTQGLALFVFFTIGAVWDSQGFIAAMDRLDAITTAVISIIAVTTFLFIVIRAGSTPPTIDGTVRTVNSIALGLAASLSGTVCVITVSQLLARVGITIRWVAFIGTRTLEIFVAHVLVAAGMRIALNQIGFDQPSLQILAGTLGGVIIPILIWWACKKLNFRYLFAPPRLLSGELPRQSSP